MQPARMPTAGVCTQAASEAKWEQRMAKDLEADADERSPAVSLSAADERQVAGLRQVRGCQQVARRVHCI